MSGRTPNSSIRKTIDVNVQTIRQAIGSEPLTLPSHSGSGRLLILLVELRSMIKIVRVIPASRKPTR
jgi:hypothetical protein